MNLSVEKTKSVIQALFAKGFVDTIENQHIIGRGGRLP